MEVYLLDSTVQRFWVDPSFTREFNLFVRPFYPTCIIRVEKYLQKDKEPSLESVKQTWRSNKRYSLFDFL